jgi:folate-dependent phosphoribosylglycinamide formyltransferase PurN
MATPPRFVAVTSSDVEAGTVINYLLRTTGVKLDRVYCDTLGDRSPKSRTQKAANSPARPTQWQKLCWHCRLSLRLPRYYAWRVLEKVTGRSQWNLLRFCETISPRFFRRVCGLALDPALAAHGRLLYTLEEATSEHRIPLTMTPNINNPETVNSLTELRPDVIIGLGTRILSQDVLRTASMGVLNGHSSLLPAYRGSTTEFWQLAGGESVTGVTIHWMVARVDQGAICAQRSWPIPAGADHHLLRLMSIFYRLELWSEVVRGLLSGTLESRPQGPSPTPTFRRPTFREVYDFYCKCVRPITISSEQAIKFPSTVN